MFRRIASVPFGAYWPWIGASLLVALVHVPTLGYYFSFDDLVPIADIRNIPAGQLMRNVLTMRDATPSWRPLTMLVYLGEYKLFGEHVLAYRLLHLGAHLLNVFLVYVLAMRFTQMRGASMFAALGFGVFGAAWDTVTYITALPHILAVGWVLLSAYLLLEFVDSGETQTDLAWGSLVYLLLAFLADEAAVALAPLPPLLYLLCPRRLRSWRRFGVIGAAFATLPTVFGAVFLFCDCRDAFTVEQRWNITSIEQGWMYLGWLAVPAGDAPYRFELQQGVTGGVGLALLAYGMWRGPWWVRWSVVGVALALVPYALIEPVTGQRLLVAPRYAYVASPFFLLVLTWVLTRFASAVPSPKAARGLTLVLAGAVLLGYVVETVTYNQRVLSSREFTGHLVEELRTRDFRPGSRVILVGEPWSNAFVVFRGLPTIRRFVYGDTLTGPSLEGWRPDILDAWLGRRSYELGPGVLVLRYEKGKFFVMTTEEMRNGALRKLSP